MIENKQYFPYQNIVLSFLVVVAVTAVLYFASPIIIPLVVAVALAYILSPLVTLIKKLKVPHVLAVILVLIITALIIVVIGYFLTIQVTSLLEELPSYWNSVVESSVKFLDMYKRIFPQARELDVSSLELKDLSGVTQYLVRGISSTLTFLSSLVLVFFFTFFMLNDQEMMKRKIIKAFDKAGEGSAARILEEINSQIRKYILVQWR